MWWKNAFYISVPQILNLFIINQSLLYLEKFAICFLEKTKQGVHDNKDGQLYFLTTWLFWKVVKQ